jgi:hypothetical protein
MIKGHKKVHIVPVAFEFDRAVLPVLEIGADKIYLLTGAQEGEGPLTSAMGMRVKRKLQKRVKDVEIVNYGFYDYNNIFRHLVKIARDEKDNHVMINLSSGGRIVAIAGTLAASMYGWNPYYAKPEEYGGKERSKGLDEIFEIMTYPVAKPEDELVTCLSLMDGIETQKSLMLKLEKTGIFVDEVPGKKLSKRSYMEFKRSYMDPLVEKGWITKDTKGRTSRLEITKEGGEIVKIFG